MFDLFRTKSHARSFGSKSLSSLRARLQPCHKPLAGNAALAAEVRSSRKAATRWIQAGVAALLVVIMLGANATATGDDGTERFDRVGHKFMCVCGCGQVLVECNHVGCPDSARMLHELRKQLAANPGGAAGPVTPGGSSSSGSFGASGGDNAVLAWFSAKYGGMVLAAPIRGGFDNVAWIVPIALFILATIGTAILVRMWSSRQRPALSTAAGYSPPIDDDLRARIRRETEY